jgi:predicted phosphodiesterase
VRHLPQVFWVTAWFLVPSAAQAATYTYVSEGTPLVYLKGTVDPPPDWASPTGDEAGWLAGEAGFGIGYGDNDDRTVLADMEGGYLTVYARAHFFVGAEREGLVSLELRARFDDGFVAYLNGVEIARSHLPSGSISRQTPAASHEVTDGEARFSVSPALLVPGDNLFAVEVHNTSLTSSDLSFIPTLSGEGPRVVLGPYVQQVSRRSLVVCYETDLPAPSRVAFRAEGAAGGLVGDPAPKTRHEVVLSGLEPGTTYAYRIEAVHPTPVEATVHTEGDRAEPLRLAVFGDTRTNHVAHALVVWRVVAEAPDLVLNTGDLVESSTVDNWRTFFSVEAPLVSAVNLLPVLGNHEGNGVLYLEKFVLPADSPGGEKYYVRRFGLVAIVGLDLYLSAFSQGSAQYAWLESTLTALAADPDLRFIFVQLHQGPYDSGSHGSNLTVRSDLVPLFERHGVAIVFSGHDHDYERSTVNGVKYVVTGGGGAPLYPVAGAAWTEVSASDHHYCILDIEGARLHFRAVRAVDGTILDEFWLGEGVSECAHADDCHGRAHGECPPPDPGEWRCVARSCIWNCKAEQGRPDGGASPDAGAPVADGGADDGGASGGLLADAGVSLEDAGTAADGGGGSEPTTRGGGCGCGAAPGGVAGVLLSCLWILPWLRPRIRRRGHNFFSLATRSRGMREGTHGGAVGRAAETVRGRYCGFGGRAQDSPKNSAARSA